MAQTDPQTTKTRKCRRCNGSGYYGSIGICFHCNGAGYAPVPVHLTKDQLAANAAKIAAEEAEIEAAFQARQAARRAARANQETNR